MGFHINLELEKYRILWPPMPRVEDIINYDLDDNQCVWRQIKPTIITSDFIALEAYRVAQGAFIKIKDTVLWIPPNYYQYLQYGIAGGVSPEFRLKRLKHHYFKIWVRSNKEAIGTYTIKNRQDGETTCVMTDIFWEARDGQSTHGQFGVQSKTNEDAFNPCWMAAQAAWGNFPKWYKELFFPDFASGNHIETQIRFKRDETSRKNLRGETEILPSRNIYMTYYPSVYNAMDGKQNMLKCVLDEANKWKNCSLTDTLINYKKFILVGSERKGLFDVFSSPADVNGKWNDEAYDLWERSNPDILDENGTTKSRIFRYHSNPLEGIQGMYDKFGDADPNRIYNFIMRERNALPEDKRLGEVRGLPLNEDEMFGRYETSQYWDNQKGIIARRLTISRSIYKDNKTLEPKYVWGNLEWENGVLDSFVMFRPNPDGNYFDLQKGRFCFSEFPQFILSLLESKEPPEYIEGVVGNDVYHLGKGTKRKTSASKAGVVHLKFREFGNESFVMHPTCIYSCRPLHIHTYFEDMILLCVFTRSKMQYERTSDEIERYFDDRGYSKWILNSSINEAKSKSEIGRGRGGGAFMTEVKSLINILTNLPRYPDQPYLIEHFWFEQLLEQLEKFDENETSKFDLVMGLGQALIGMAKIISTKTRKGTQLASQALSYILS